MFNLGSVKKRLGPEPKLTLNKRFLAKRLTKVQWKNV